MCRRSRWHFRNFFVEVVLRVADRCRYVVQAADWLVHPQKLLAPLDARFPGLRFRVVDEQGAIRPHIKMFVDGVLAPGLAAPVAGARELMIVGALSGG